ncbi:MAG TPA: alcohol dehydrogenase catalytic domain-containing protein [Frankiaceae bacterium]|jgi:S-(hydroxymethyl)glutathione dehydrogenase/alcohol dehydrogenase|nr:alcohol dehydrogenase catalytic domain-containing protein [Frankiaceae bacterium]
MKAWVARAGGQPPELESVDVAAPLAGEVRVRLAATGVCGSDLSVLAGKSPVAQFPLVLGHEGAGVIEEVGAGVTSVAPGDHVVIALYGPCLACRNCLSGNPVHCNGPARIKAITGAMADGSTRLSSNGERVFPFVGSGTLAEEAVLRASQVVAIAKDIPLDVICLAGCGVTTGLGAVFNIAEVRPGESVAVVGCGGVGLSVIQGARIAGAGQIIAVDTNPYKLELARGMGATDEVLLEEGGLSEAISACCPGGVDAAFEVVGNGDLVAAALASTRPGGRCVMVGSPPAGTTIPVDGRVLFSERRLLGCTGGSNIPARDIPRIERLYRSGALELDALVSQRFSFADARDAFAAAQAGQVARAVVVMD